MQFQEFCEAFSVEAMRRFAALIPHLPQLYDRYEEEGGSIRAFCGRVLAPSAEALSPADPKVRVNQPVRTADLRDRLEEAQLPLFDRLRAFRASLAREHQVPAYVIFPNKVLYELCVHPPGTDEELRALPSIGPKTAEKYGNLILAEIRKAARDLE